MTKDLERESFKAKLAALSSQPAIDDAAFAGVIYDAMTRFGITEQSFRDAFGLTGGAVLRWTTEQNLPQASVRGKIIDWISEQF